MKVPSSNLTTTQLEAIRWHSRLKNKRCSEKVKQNFAEWLAAASEHQQAFQLIEQMWSDFGQFSVLASTEIADARKLAYQTQSNTKRRNSLLVMLCVIAGFGFAHPEFVLKQLAQHYQTAKGQTVKLTLKDGSLVQINTETDISVADFLGIRKIWLNSGEAWFAVTHNPESSFEVYTPQGKLRDIGTRFNVFAEQTQTTLTVEQGEVEVETLTSQRLNFTENQQAVFDQQGGLLRKDHIDTAKFTAWRTGILIFQGQTLAQVLDQISRYHQVTFLVQDSKLKFKTISGRFSTTDLLGTLHTLSVGMNIKISQYQPGRFLIKKS